MSVLLREPWTQETFLDWAGAQEGHYEFDGFQPFAMTGGNLNHSRITLNVLMALDRILRGTGYSSFGDVGVATIGNAIRYPDAVITCTKAPGTDRLAPSAVIVFEVISLSTSRVDRIIKVREYVAVTSIRRYVIVESEVIGLTVLEKQSDNSWKHKPMTGEDDVLVFSEVNVTVPAAELYEDVDLRQTDPE